MRSKPVRASKLTFEVQEKINFGEDLKVVGSVEQLGNWNADSCLQLGWTEGDVWKTQKEVEIPDDTDLEFKLIKSANGNVQWESGANRKVKQINNQEVRIRCTFNNASQTNVEIIKDSDGKLQEGSERKSSDESKSQQPHKNGAPKSGPELDAAVENRIEQRDNNGVVNSDVGENKEGWQGRSVQFMESNEHPRERQGSWDTTGLEGPMLEVVAGDKDSESWLQKLQVVEKIICSEKDSNKIDALDIASCFIYLQWISQGVIPCVEGGGHFRPNRHAEIAQQIFVSLEKIIADPKTPMNVSYLCRRLNLRLPSFQNQFTSSQPLTIIRDIAHRNDIPQDLKRKIKHTIQNKLHRNAGPEDLEATEQLLKQIKSEQGNYSQDFVKQFENFAVQLRQFFNAGSLTDLFQAVKENADQSVIQAIDTFVDSKNQMDTNQGSVNHMMNALSSLVDLRSALQGQLASSQGNGEEKNLAGWQLTRLADVKSEDFVFVLLSQLTNQLENQLNQQPENAENWNLSLQASILAAQNLNFAGANQQEVSAIKNELQAWKDKGDFASRENSLRIKATLDRLRRISNAFSDNLVSALNEPANKIGKALNIEERLQGMVAEGEIRASVVYQISRLVTVQAKAIRTILKESPMSVIVPGTQEGVLIKVDEIKSDQEFAEDTILLINQVQGDEDVATLSKKVTAIIVNQDLPILSHLSIRARQGHLTTVCCDDGDYLRGLTDTLVGKKVKIDASQEGVQISEATGGAKQKSKKAKGGKGKASLTKEEVGAESLSVKLAKKLQVIQMDMTETDSCGSKAANCSNLVKMSVSANEKLFDTPPSCCVPFGTQDVLLKKQKLYDQFQKSVEQIQKADVKNNRAQLIQHCNSIAQIIQQLDIPQEFLQEIFANFQPGDYLIFRSSANVEDRKGLSGAGLYESIGGIQTSSHNKAVEAIKQVWQSLYSQRAVLSRRAAGILETDAQMAVLIQAQLNSEISFVLHTSGTGMSNNMVGEFAIGQGEVLAQSVRGSPYRVEMDKKSGTVKVNSFGSMSEAQDIKREKRIVDYSKEQMSIDGEFLKSTCARIMKIGKYLDQKLGPQDVEGAVIGNQIFVVQTRPQPL